MKEHFQSERNEIEVLPNGRFEFFPLWSNKLKKRLLFNLSNILKIKNSDSGSPFSFKLMNSLKYYLII